MFSFKPLEEARVQSFSVFCIPTGGTHITSDMCAGIHISLRHRHSPCESRDFRRVTPAYYGAFSAGVTHRSRENRQSRSQSRRSLDQRSGIQACAERLWERDSASVSAAISILVPRAAILLASASDRELWKVPIRSRH